MSRLLTLALVACGCAGAGSASSRPPALTPVVAQGAQQDSARASAEPQRPDLSTRISAYEHNAAVWVPGQAVAVNRDFDFALAMSVDDIGPGIAAGKRKTDNEAFAKQLTALAPIDVPARLRAACAAAPASRACAEGRRVDAYALLFGVSEARLQVLLELAEPSQPVTLYAVVTATRPLDSFAQPGVLQSAFDEGLGAIVTWLATTSARSTAAQLGQCNVGGRANVTGQVAASDDRHVLLALSEPAARQLLCPKDAFVIAPEKPESAGAIAPGSTP